MSCLERALFGMGKQLALQQGLGQPVLVIFHLENDGQALRDLASAYQHVSGLYV